MKNNAGFRIFVGMLILDIVLLLCFAVSVMKQDMEHESTCTAKGGVILYGHHQHYCVRPDIFVEKPAS